jgi:hypothetical protein
VLHERRDRLGYLAGREVVEEMKERPILFSGPMVRALLEGSKTQTRRILKHPEWFGCFTGDCPHYNADDCLPEIEKYVMESCPYGRAGDRLWVRETIFRGQPVGDGYDSAVYAADGGLTPLDRWYWKRDILPSIHCPYGLSRLTLEVTGVRVEQVQNIIEADAKAEGSALWAHETVTVPTGNKFPSHRHAFQALWDSINAARGFGWSANPWVWVVDFKRLK